MKILFLGDVMGRAAREAVLRQVPLWRKQWVLDFVIVNGENAASGFGITPAIAEAFFEAGVDVISTGNHVWDHQEIQGYIDSENRLLRPVNFPSGTPGIGANLYQTGDRRVMVVNVMGQLFLETLDDPFVAIERELTACPLGEAADAIIVDVHAEAHLKKWRWGIFATAVRALWSAPTPMFRRRMHRFCQMAPPIRQMRACAAIMTVYSTWKKKSP